MGPQLKLGIPLLVLLLFVTSVRGSGIAFQTISYGTSSGYKSESTLIIRDNATWQALWSNLTAIDNPPGAPSTPDFNTQMAIAAMMGPQPTCDSSIHITDIFLHENVLSINITKVLGNPNIESPCPTNISPFHVVQTQRYDGPTSTQTTTSSSPPGAMSPNISFALPGALVIIAIVGIALISARHLRSSNARSAALT